MTLLLLTGTGKEAGSGSQALEDVLGRCIALPTILCLCGCYVDALPVPFQAEVQWEGAPSATYVYVVCLADWLSYPYVLLCADGAVVIRSLPA